MEAIRKIMPLSEINSIISLPWENENINVEVFVFPIKNNNTENIIPTPSTMKGILKQYTKPDLIDMEKYAWEINVKEKY